MAKMLIMHKAHVIMGIHALVRLVPKKTNIIDPTNNAFKNQNAPNKSSNVFIETNATTEQ